MKDYFKKNGYNKSMLFLAILISLLLVYFDFKTNIQIAIGSLYVIPVFLLYNQSKKTILFFSIVFVLILLYQVLFYLNYKPDFNLTVDALTSILAIITFTFIALKYNASQNAVIKQKEDLINQEKKFHDTIDNLLEGCWTLSFDWRYLYINDAAVKQGKYAGKEDLLGFTVMEKFPGIESYELFRVMEHCMKERVSRVFEHEFNYPDNSKAYFLASIQPVPEGIFVLSVDISDSKKAEIKKQAYTKSLEDILTITSHQVRHPVVNIMGLSNLLDQEAVSLADLNKIVGLMNQEAVLLDNYTRDLTSFINDLQRGNH